MLSVSPARSAPELADVPRPTAPRARACLKLLPGLDSTSDDRRSMRSCARFGILVFPWIMACALSRGVDVEIDPSLTDERIRNSRIAVGGMTWEADSQADQFSSIQLGSLLGSTIAAERPDLSVVSVVEVAEALGPRTHARLLEAQRTGGELDSTLLTELSDRLQGVQFVLFASVESDEIVHADEEISRVEEREGEQCDIEETRKSVSRTMIVGFQMYDIQYKRIVAAGRIDEMREEANEYESWNSCSSLLEDLADYVVEETLGIRDRPEAPPLGPMLEGTFRKFARQLPD